MFFTEKSRFLKWCVFKLAERILQLNGQVHDKTNKITYAPSEDSDQPCIPTPTPSLRALKDALSECKMQDIFW